MYENVKLKFTDYTKESLKHLDQVVDALMTASHEVKSYIEKFKDDQKTYGIAYQDYENLLMEINRFQYGIDCIKIYPDAHKAFRYMNETFALDTEKFDSWRLFQLVFIVSNIPDMIVSEYGVEELSAIQSYKVSDMVDILYFSTGGGKTEAFLGCVLFSLFF